MEIDTRIVFRTPTVTGCATMVGNDIAVCDLRTMGDLLAEMAGDTTINALHNDVIDACDTLDIEWPSLYLYAA